MNQTENRILLLDDEKSIRIVLSKGLERKGFKVDLASDIGEARELLNEYNYFLALIDIKLPDGSGLELMESIHLRPNNPSIIVMTAEATMDNAIKAMQKGAFDYFTKPFDLEQVEGLVAKVVEYRKSGAAMKDRPKGKSAASAPDELIGRAPAMQEVFKLIGRLADSDLTVLVTGPTGAGKELVSRALHYNSSRKKGPFITVNCAAIPAELLESELFGHVKGAFTGAVEDKKGKFLAGDGGAILLDEVGDMPLPLQAKMLRVLQEKEIFPVGATKPIGTDVRIIASTNRDLKADVQEKRFRKDLYHRINVAHIELPALKDRKEDVPILVEHFVLKITKLTLDKTKSLTLEAMEKLAHYDWPGNVRELENVIRRAYLMAPGKVISVDHLPPELTSEADNAPPEILADLSHAVLERMMKAEDGAIYQSVITEVEKELIEAALKREGGALVRTAKLLGINRNTLAAKIKELKINR